MFPTNATEWIALASIVSVFVVGILQWRNSSKSGQNDGFDKLTRAYASLVDDYDGRIKDLDKDIKEIRVELKTSRSELETVKTELRTYKNAFARAITFIHNQDPLAEIPNFFETNPTIGKKK